MYFMISRYHPVAVDHPFNGAFPVSRYARLYVIDGENFIGLIRFTGRSIWPKALVAFTPHPEIFYKMLLLLLRWSQ